jgi:hypothetical protein
MKQLSPVQHRLLDFAVQVREYGYEPEKAFVSREMVQATLPHKNPGDVPAWSRRNGNYALTIQPGWDTWEKKSYGYPYGTIPRLLIFWLTTEALRTDNRRLELGSHLADFMRKLGLDPSRGGKRSDAHRLREQMERLFRARISFEYRDDRQQSWLDMQIAPKGMLWWSETLSEQPTLWESWVELGEEFFKAITSHPIPVNMDALQALKKSPLALDLYAWLAHEAFRASTSKRTRRVTWRALHGQLGAEYNDIQNFRRKAVEAIRKIEVVYPGLRLDTVEGGLEIKPGATAIPAKAKANKTIDVKPVSATVIPLPSVVSPQSPTKVSVQAIEQAKVLLRDASANWDVYALEAAFYEYAAKKSQPKHVDRAFIGFVRRKIKPEG